VENIGGRGSLGEQNQKSAAEREGTAGEGRRSKVSWKKRSLCPKDRNKQREGELGKEKGALGGGGGCEPPRKKKGEEEGRIPRFGRGNQTYFILLIWP